MLTEKPASSFLGPDRKLPFLDLAWSRRGRLDFFNRVVLPAAYPDATAAWVSIEDMTYSPERECVVLYALGVEGEDHARWATATFSKDDRLGAVFARRGSGVLLPEQRCLVELFPADWRLPRLAPLVAPERAAAALAALGPERRRAARNAPLEVVVLRYRPHQRCVLRYVGLTEDGAPLDVIAKVFRHAEKAASSWRTLTELRDQARPLGLRVPAPLALVRSRNLLLMDCLGGSPLKHAVHDAAGEQAGELAELAATVLALLHTMRIEARELRSLEEELDLLRRRARRIPAVAPLFGERLGAVLARIGFSASRLPRGPRRFVHGDFKPSQLLLEGDRVALVDFDRAALGDPALDVGNFMAQFRKEALRGAPEHVRGASATFLAAYEDLRPQGGLRERAAVFEALALARMAVRSFRRSPHVYASRGPESPSLRLLEEAATCLDAL